MKRQYLSSIALLACVSLAAIVYAEVPRLINYQGILTGTEGTPINGTHNLTFQIYPDDTPGAVPLWTEVHTGVQVSDGLFNVILGGTEPILDSLFISNERWLGITVDTDSEIAPRSQLTTVPFAFVGAVADSAKTVNWAGILDLPPGFADGVDDEGGGSMGDGYSLDAADGDPVNVVFVDNEGDVGIGTTSPVWELEVANLAEGDGVEIGVSANDATGALAAYSSTMPDPFTHFAGRVSLFAGGETTGLDLRADGLEGDIRFFTGGPWLFSERMRITPGGSIRITSHRDDGLGSWEEGLCFANNSNWMGPWTQAGIWTDGVSGFNGELVFGVDGNGELDLIGIQEAMRINIFGNLGIGTMYPAHRLHISNTDATNGGVGRFSNDQGISVDIGVAGSNSGWPAGNNNPYIFTENTDLVIITGTGLVGIGTTDPVDGKLCIANGATDEAYISLNPGGAALNDIMGIRVSESGNNTTKMHLGREFTTDGTFLDFVTMDSGGNIGIGTTNPQSALDVAGLTRTEVLEITGGSDLSEQFDVNEDTMKAEPGMVVCIDSQRPGKLKISQKAYDRSVAGIISGAKGIKTGMMMGQKGALTDGEHPVVLTGRVYCWADASNHSIEPGDLLTTASIAGYAMKVTDFDKAQGAVLGKAMTPLASGRGMVLVLVNLQ
jgi:hypothetical protein